MHNIKHLSKEHRKKLSEVHTKHGGTYTRLFKIWGGMKTRCLNVKAINYGRYGGRGISIIPEWKSSFENFRDWALANGYNDTLTIDRVDNNKGYYPTNCRWISSVENVIKNRSKPVNQLDLDGNILATFSSICEAQRQTGTSNQNIVEVCKDKRKTAGGYRWKYMLGDNNE